MSFIYFSPFGQLSINTLKTKIISLDFAVNKNNKCSPEESFEYVVKKQLDEYFFGQRQKFSLPLKLSGTVFQNMVWQKIINIPYGQTRSYKQLAQQMKIPNSYRAIANALGKNPLPIVIPCHRIIKSDGAIGGYSGGKEIKKFLLNFEKNTKKTLPKNDTILMTN
ncbi:MAG: methylated-DNA--[protein]-cysteine S-methyltransferase [Patescibacteria group bacterium]